MANDSNSNATTEAGRKLGETMGDFARKHPEIAAEEAKRRAEAAKRPNPSSN